MGQVGIIPKGYSEDSRRLCFEQGRACIYRDQEDPDIITTEEVNGVVSRHQVSTGKITRTWPDGRVEHFHKSDQQNLEYPHIPRQE